MNEIWREMQKEVVRQTPTRLLLETFENDMAGRLAALAAVRLTSDANIVEVLNGFYGAAAFFFQQAPWKKVGYEAAIKVECAKYQGGPWYAVLMGQSGLTTGLALYKDLEPLRRLWAGDRADEENARRAVATLRPPLAWELELMEGCLRAVPDFVARHRQDDPAREEMTVPAASGELQLVLSWVVEDG
jgi:hypothetical protein